MEPYFEIYLFDDNARIDVFLPWKKFSVFEKIIDNCGFKYRLKHEVNVSAGRVKFWYEEYGNLENEHIEQLVPLRIFAEYQFDTFSLGIPDCLNDDAPCLVKKGLDKITEAKLLCLEMIDCELRKTKWFALF